jgi:hypothetical protein
MADGDGMTGDARKKTREAREIRRLASRIPDHATFEKIIAQVGADQKSDIIRRQMQQAVMVQLIPYLKFDLQRHIQA